MWQKHSNRIIENENFSYETSKKFNDSIMFEITTKP